MDEAVQIVTGFILALVAGGVGALSTYRLGIRKTFEEQKKEARIRTYRELMTLLDMTIEGVKKKNQDEANERIGDIQNLLLFYAPDEVYRAHVEAFRKGQETKSAWFLVQFKLLLRKEFFPKSDLGVDDVTTIKFTG